MAGYGDLIESAQNDYEEPEGSSQIGSNRDIVISHLNHEIRCLERKLAERPEPPAEVTKRLNVIDRRIDYLQGIMSGIQKILEGKEPWWATSPQKVMILEKLEEILGALRP